MFRFNSNIRIFSKGGVNSHRRLGVLLARDISVEKALEKIERAYSKLDVKLYSFLEISIIENTKSAVNF